MANMAGSVEADPDLVSGLASAGRLIMIESAEH